MAGNALIGALRATLGLDTAQFETGLKTARSSLASFGKLAATSFKAAAAGATVAGAALAVAVKGAIDHADALSKAAQKIGVATDALSRLEWAAKLSDVTLEQLTAGLGRLSKSMLDVANGSKGPAAEAFAALGISVTDASGQLRSADDVFADIADRFARLEDGSTKTALAISVFGRAGAELIPMLNSGRDGLAQMAAESDRLGLTISSKTGKAAEEFNDTLTRISAIMDGVVRKIMEAALPSLQALAGTFADPNFAAAVGGFGKLAVDALNLIAQGAANAANNIRMLKDALASVDQMSTAGLEGRLTELGKKKLDLDNLIVETQSRLARGDTLFGINEGALRAQIETTRQQIEELTQQEQQILDLLAKRDADAAEGAGSEGVLFTPVAFTPDLGGFKTSTDAATAAQKALNDAVSEGQSLFQSTRDPIEQLRLQMDRLGHLLNQGAIDWDTYGRAANAAHMEAAASALGMAGQVTGALANIFEGNKAFAVANAVINTAEGITKALAQGGMFGFIGAAAVAASGAAQVASILATQPGSASAATVGGGAAETTEAAAATSAPSIYLELKGSRFSRADVEGLIKDINAAIKDGVQLQGVT